MSRFIIHPGTLTVINAAECFILDLDADITAEERDMLDGDDYYDDTLICTLAEQYGVRI